MILKLLAVALAILAISVVVLVIVVAIVTQFLLSDISSAAAVSVVVWWSRL